MAGETYYSLLEIPESASALEIRTSYRRLMLDVHPDRLANAPAYWQSLAEEKAKQINEAFTVLSDPEGRRLYDAKLQAYRGSQRSASATPSAQPSSPPSRSPRQRWTQSPSGYQGGSGASRQSAPPSSGVPGSAVKPTPYGVSPGHRLFFALILGSFGCGAAGAFWDSTSLGEGIFLFALAGGLLFAIACLYQRGLSRLLSALRVTRPKHQLLATIGAITFLLAAGKIVYSLRQSNAPSPPQPSAADSGAGLPSHFQPDSGKKSSSSSSADSVIPMSLPNGTEILKKRRNGGYGEFTVDNGTADDAVVELVDAETKKAIRAFYVESGNKFTEGHIRPGTYSIYYMTGMGWNASNRQFNRRGEFGVFDQTATFSEKRNDETGEIDYHEFSITLHPVIGGTGRTSVLDADEFERAMAEADSQ